MPSLTRRSFCSTAAAAGLFFSARSSLAQSAPDWKRNDVVPGSPRLEKISSDAGTTAFLYQLLEELGHDEIFSVQRIGKMRHFFASMLASSIIKNHAEDISLALNIPVEAALHLAQTPKQQLSRQEWASLADRVNPQDSPSLYLLAEKAQHDLATLALARSRHSISIATHRPEPGETPLQLRQAFGLYFNPQGPYGLGGTEEQQRKAREFVYSVRNDHALSRNDFQSLLKDVPPAYAVAMATALDHYAFFLGKIHLSPSHNIAPAISYLRETAPYQPVMVSWRPTPSEEKGKNKSRDSINVAQTMPKSSLTPNALQPEH